MSFKKLLFVSMLSIGFTVSAFAAKNVENTSSDAQAVDSACTQEAQTASCGSEKVGTGLMKCIHAYKKANKKSFKISSGCKAAIKQLKADHKAKKST